MAESNRLKVIVLDVFSRMGLAVVNGLAPAHDVVGGAIGDPRGTEPRGRGTRSPHLVDLFRYPSPLKDPDGFEDAIVAACDRFGADAVFPASSASTLALARLRTHRQGDLTASLVVEDEAKLARLVDKWELFRLCRELEIPTPRTVLPVGDGREEALSMPLPVVAKPRASEAARGVMIVETRAELEEIIDNPPQFGSEVGEGEYPYVVQELVPNGEIHDAKGCGAKGEPVSMITTHRVLTRHEFGGNGLVHVTTDEPEIRRHVENMMRLLEWNGAFDLEFLRTADGRYHALDANPRVWGSVELSIALGQNIALQALEVIALGRTPTATLDYPIGTECRWLMPGSLACCVREPRTPAKISWRLRTLLVPRRNTITNLKRQNLRHLVGMSLDNRAKRSRARTGR